MFRAVLTALFCITLAMPDLGSAQPAMSRARAKRLIHQHKNLHGKKLKITKSTSAASSATIGCFRLPPILDTAALTSAVRPGQFAQFFFTIINTDLSVCGSSQFLLTISGPLGWGSEQQTFGASTYMPILRAGRILAPSGASDGVYNINVTLTNLSSGLSTTASTQLTVDSSPPVIDLTVGVQDSNDIIEGNSELPPSGNLNISAGLDLLSPSNDTILQSLQLIIDGAVVASSQGENPAVFYNWAWDLGTTSQPLNGIHTLEVVGVDLAGNVGRERRIFCYGWSSDGKKVACNGSNSYGITLSPRDCRGKPVVLGGANGKSYGAGDFVVELFDVLGNPISGEEVTIDFSATNVVLQSIQSVDVDCAGKKLSTTTDDLGRAVFHAPRFGGYAIETRFLGVPISRGPLVSAGGLILGIAEAHSLDIDAANGLGANDLSLFLGLYGNNSSAGDFDLASGLSCITVGANDLSIWLGAFGDATNTDNYCS